MIQSIATSHDSFVAFTASLGLDALLSRAISIASPSLQLTGQFAIDSSHASSVGRRYRFFGSPARLSGLPADFSQTPILAAALVVRPGERDLMLVGEAITTSGDIEDPTAESRALLAPLETLIRDFADQWTPSRALWDVPAETAMPVIRHYSVRPGAD